MSTLAEAKAELGHVQRQIDDHKASLCTLCSLARGKRCEEQRALAAQAGELRLEIRTWFAPQPGDLTLFDEDAP